MKKRKKLPRFKSDEEAAEFWDTHSFAPYWDDTKPVKVLVRRPLKHTVHLSDGRRVTLAQFKKMRRAATER